MNSPAPLLSAIVLNYRSPQFTVKCVEALLVQTIAEKMEILVLDNHSTDDSIGVLRNRLKKYPSVRILENHANTGYGRGNTFALRHATGTYLMILNPDNLLLPDAAEKLVDALEKDPSIGIIAPQLRHEDGTIRPSFRAFPRLLDVIANRTYLGSLLGGRVHRYLKTESDPEKVQDTDWIVGACFVMRRDFYAQLGGFDPRYFLFFEDIDLCRRCWLAGKRVVYYPLAKALDRKRRLSQGGALSLLLNPVGRIHVMSGLRYFWKWRAARAEIPNPKHTNPTGNH